MSESSMSDKEVQFFSKPESVPNYAELFKVSKSIAARRIKARVDAGELKLTGKEIRVSRRGQRPNLYVRSNA